MKKINGNTIIGLIFLIAAGMTMYVANTTLKATAPAGDPGSRLFPNLACGAIMLLAIIIIIQSFQNPTKVFAGIFTDESGKQSHIRTLLIVADLILFLILWNFIPFLAAGFIFMFLQCMIFREKLVFSLLYSAGVTGVLYVVFAIFLKVRLNIY